MTSYEDMLDKAYAKLPTASKADAVRLDIPQIKGALSGNKTIIYNLDVIAKAVRRDLQHVFKFFLRELATTGDLKGAEAIFVGKFRPDMLNNKVEKYIKEFVLCPQCGKPDTHLEKADAATLLICEACGAKESVRSLK
ncbi:MAG: translation initiation factor IF-2 subunit beta [DPANN group archaeon]|nr:translation initiation factor IF-2 subunit beta [DPANN group archaeon]